MKDSISVVVPCYNTRDSLPELYSGLTPYPPIPCHGTQQGHASAHNSIGQWADRKRFQDTLAHITSYTQNEHNEIIVHGFSLLCFRFHGKSLLRCRGTYHVGRPIHHAEMHSRQILADYSQSE